MFSKAWCTRQPNETCRKEIPEFYFYFILRKLFKNLYQYLLCCLTVVCIYFKSEESFIEDYTQHLYCWGAQSKRETTGLGPLLYAQKNMLISWGGIRRHDSLCIRNFCCNPHRIDANDDLSGQKFFPHCE